MLLKEEKCACVFVYVFVCTYACMYTQCMQDFVNVIQFARVQSCSVVAVGIEALKQLLSSPNLNLEEDIGTDRCCEWIGER